MTERDLGRILHESVQDVHLSDEARRAIRLAAKEEQPVKMKKFVAIVLAVMLALSTTAAVAAELGMFDFLSRKMGQTVLPGANELVKMDVVVFSVIGKFYLFSKLYRTSAGFPKCFCPHCFLIFFKHFISILENSPD